ncbi:MAG: RDD family protein [Actinomycetota bacterium]|nr:RDD family protein [Actinomycetota bacterium]
MAQVPQQPVPQTAGGGGPSGPRAGFGARLGAFLIDVIILGVVGGIVGAIFGAKPGEFNGSSQAINTLIGLAYFIYFEGGATGQTLGKKVLNIRVIDFATGGALGYGKATGRYFARILSTIPIALGYFWMLWDKEKQTWHDKLAGSVVVPTSSYPVQT